MSVLGIFRALRNLWCDRLHGGGRIKRDPSGRINWQCQKCGRWDEPVREPKR